DDGPPVIGPCLCQGPRAATAAPTQATTLSPGMVDFSQSSGAVSIYYNPQTYTNPTIYSANVTGQLTAYMLVNNVTNLQDISTNPNGTYALGTNINAGAFAPLPSSTPFNGLLDGNGGLGVNYTISNLPRMLFPETGSNALIRNITLANVNIAATADNQTIGALTGLNLGTILNSSVSGVINGGLFTRLTVGGAAGQSAGTISHAVSSVNISVGDPSRSNQFNFAGGLVGFNLGTITDSSASGNITAASAAGQAGSNFSILGGFVSINVGTISNGQATG